MLTLRTVFSAFRIYAIWGRNIWLFLLVLLPNLVSVGTNFVCPVCGLCVERHVLFAGQFASVVFTPVWLGPPINSCVLNDPVPPATDKRYVLCSLILFILHGRLIIFCRSTSSMSIAYIVDLTIPTTRSSTASNPAVSHRRGLTRAPAYVDEDVPPSRVC